MKIFISWSKPRSMALATALADWLPRVVQSVQCFQSDEGIRAGQRWLTEINAELEASNFGILCVTPENIGEPWLNFEAGAIAKQVSAGIRVVPVTLGFSPSLLEAPLGQFNGVQATADGIKRLLVSINDAAGADIDVEDAFAVWWPRLEAKLTEISAAETDVEPPAPPSLDERIAEVLGVVQGIQVDVGKTRQMVHDRGRYADPAELFEMIELAKLMSEDPQVRKAVANGGPQRVRALLNSIRHQGARGGFVYSRREAAEDRERHAAMTEELYNSPIPEADEEDEIIDPETGDAAVFPGKTVG